MPAEEYGQPHEYGTGNSPATGGAAVTPHDVTEFTYLTRWLYVGGAGNVAAVLRDGTVLSFVGVPVGTLLPIQAKRVNLTGTTATNLVGLF